MGSEGLGMSADLAKVLAATSRLETLAEGHDRRLVELKEVTTKRLDAHGKDIRSLNKTRDRQWGAAKGLGFVGTIFGAIIGWFKYG